MRRGVLSLMAVVALIGGGCGSGRSATSQQIDQQVVMKQLLLSQLKDPGSAQFEDVRAYVVRKDGDKLTYSFCGRVNSKNSFGGYAGAQRFVGNAGIVAFENDTPDFAIIWARFCTDETGGKSVWL